VTFFEVKNKPVELKGPIIWPASDISLQVAPTNESRIDLSSFLTACLGPDGVRSLVSVILSPDAGISTRATNAFAQVASHTSEEICVDAVTAIARRANLQLTTHPGTIAENSLVISRLFNDLKHIRRTSQSQGTLNAATTACYSLVISALKDCRPLEAPLPKQLMEQLRVEKIHPLNNVISWFKNTSLENRQAYYKEFPTSVTTLPQDVLVMAMLEPNANEAKKLLRYFCRNLAQQDENVGMLAPAIGHVMGAHLKLFSEFAPEAASLGSHTLASIISTELSPNDAIASRTIVNMSHVLPSRISPEGFLLLVETVKNQSLKSAERREALQVIEDNFITFTRDSAERLLPELAYTLQDKDEMDVQLKTLAAQLLVKLLKDFPDIHHDLDETLICAIPDLVDLSYYSEAENKVLSILSKEVFTLLCHKELELGELALQLRDTLGTDIVKKIVADQNLRPAEMKKLLADLLLANGIAESIPRMFEKHALDRQAATDLEGTDFAQTAVKSEGQLVRVLSLMNDVVHRMYKEAVEHLYQKLDVVLEAMQSRYESEFLAGTPLPTFVQVLRLNTQSRLQAGL
jgi:hypothetical protein